jgi:hypothetical protein
MFHPPIVGRQTLRLSVLALLAASWAVSGCGGGSYFRILSGPFPDPQGATAATTSPGATATTPGGGGSGNLGTPDPCDETQARKFIRISMRNTSDDTIHYFLVLVAFVNSTRYPGGAVCSDDIGLYTSFGYSLVPAGSRRAFGNFCFDGPALIYFHRAGQFRAPGSTTLSSAIPPAQGSAATYDAFFSSSGAQTPVPDLILFHNPGTTAEGRTLKVSLSLIEPCATGGVQIADPDCEQDSFYYVDENDQRAGSTVIGPGAYVRVPSEIQGTGCQCGLSNTPWASLAPPGTNPRTQAQCDQFFRGGRVDFAFIREDTEPPFPQLVWRVSDVSGTRVQDFDERSGVR